MHAIFRRKVVARLQLFDDFDIDIVLLFDLAYDGIPPQLTMFDPTARNLPFAAVVVARLPAFRDEQFSLVPTKTSEAEHRLFD